MSAICQYRKHISCRVSSLEQPSTYKRLCEFLTEKALDHINGRSIVSQHVVSTQRTGYIGRRFLVSEVRSVAGEDGNSMAKDL